ASWRPLTARKPDPARGKRKINTRASVRRTVAQSPSSSRRVTSPPSTPGERIAAPKQSDDVVRRAQEALERAGYEIGTPDGFMGPRTVAAIKRFQTDRYIGVTG